MRSQSNEAIEIEQLLLLEIEAIERARTNFLDFVLYTKPNYQVNWHHRLIASYLQDLVNGKIKRLMIFTPPRHGKSELVSRRLPAFAFGINPNIQIIATSYGARLAGQMSRSVQRIIDSPEYRIVFPETSLSGKNCVTIAEGNWLRNSEIFEIVGHAGMYASAGIGGGITGLGFNLGIIDDPIKDWKIADSQVQRESQWEWYTSTFETRLESEGNKDGAILITATRWHEDDICGRLLKIAKDNPLADQWTVLSLPAILDQQSDYDPRKFDEVLWPEKRDREKLLQIKMKNQRVWNALYQQRPSSFEGGIFKKSWFQYYGEVPQMFDRIMQTWDCSFEEGPDNSFVVGQVWGSLKMGGKVHHYLLDQYRKQIGFEDTKNAIRFLSSKYPKAVKKLIEKKANGAGLIDSLKKEISGLEGRPVKGEVMDSKEVRWMRAAEIASTGCIWLPDPVKFPWVVEFLDEICTVPRSTHDDQADAMSQYLLESNEGNLKQFLESMRPRY